MNLEQVQSRMSELVEIAQDEEKRNALSVEDMDALIQEKTQLEERKAVLDAEVLANQQEVAKRHKFLDDIAKGATALPVREERKGNPNMDENLIVLDSKSVEYRSAWLKDIRKLELSDVEKRALTTVSGSVGAIIPTLTMNKIVDQLKQYAPLLSEIELLAVPGGVSIAVEGTNNNAALHTEGATITASADTLTKVTLGAYEITKLITISKSVSKMSVDAFEGWLVGKLAAKLGALATYLIIYGTGSDQPQGVEKAATWGAGNSITVAVAGSLSATNVRDLIALLPGGYDAGAKFLMSKKTFYNDFIGLQDNAKHSLISQEGRQFFISGYPVMFDERVTLHEAYLGDFKAGYVGNMPEDANIVSQFVARENSFDFLGSAMFDGKVAVAAAFVKLIKATA